ncbi:type II toxin-antitoxin system RelE/ParE family toxin [Chamaesiphon sp. VAR_69_metabat_338]|uniref:type II toxin-antitoxin system RelE/ParE family toxin n=1 Tax=Chamaesiphon sp. VAR_69_metabat_338 TaxID=2964704 RepID=UPI00286DAADA|nr:type II toxin-antitoxin system RelE/ParE family toxin [Chamaesiphon sp. VAR_69_metabat_338]
MQLPLTTQMPPAIYLMTLENNVCVAKFSLSGNNYDTLKPNLRGFIIKNYIVFYTIEGENIAIIKVVSGYRDLDAIFRSK